MTVRGHRLTMIDVKADKPCGLCSCNAVFELPFKALKEMDDYDRIIDRFNNHKKVRSMPEDSKKK